MQKRNVLHSPRILELKKKRRKSSIKNILFFLLGFLVLFTSLVFLSRLNAVNINNVEIAGNQIIDTNAIKEIVEQQISGKYLWVFPKTNIFFYPENSIKNALQEKFKRLENINLSIKNNHTLYISLAERKAAYTWCGLAPLDSGTAINETTCYFIDENGYIFDQAPYFSGQVYFKFYGSPDSATSETNNFDPSGFYFSQQHFQQLISFKNILVGFGLNPVALYLTNDGNVEIFLANANSSTAGPQIIFKLNDDYQNVAENLEAALTNEPLQSEFKNKYSSLLYIDLRFGNKVYYKFQ